MSMLEFILTFSLISLIITEYYVILHYQFFKDCSNLRSEHIDTISHREENITKAEDWVFVY